MKRVICLLVWVICIGSCVTGTEIVGHWTFDDGSGSFTADSSAYGNNATLSQTSLWSNPGYDGTGSCLRFADTLSEYVEIPHDSSLVPVKNLYLSAWVKPEPANNNLIAILIKGRNSGSYYMDIFDNRLYFGLNYQNGGDHITVTGDLSVPNGLWSHVAVRYDGNYISLYVNDLLDKSIPFTSPIIDNGESLIIGADFPGYRETYKGMIDEVIIAVPEPSTMLLIGLGGLAMIRKRK